MRVMALFSPMPFTPGMLSEVSPMRLLTSMSWRGETPYFSFTASTSITAVLLRPMAVVASRTVVVSLTSCKLSRSPVARKQSSLRAAQAAERVPRMSSASQPSAVTSR